MLELARNHVCTPEERYKQRISFAYGNGGIENPDITYELVEHVAAGMAGVDLITSMSKL